MNPSENERLKELLINLSSASNFCNKDSKCVLMKCINNSIISVLEDDNHFWN